MAWFRRSTPESASNFADQFDAPLDPPSNDDDPEVQPLGFDTEPSTGLATRTTGVAVTANTTELVAIHTHKIEKALGALVALTQQLDDRLDRLEDRVSEMALMEDVATRDELDRVRHSQQQLAAEISRQSIDLRERLAHVAATRPPMPPKDQRTAIVAQQILQLSDAYNGFDEPAVIDLADAPAAGGSTTAEPSAAEPSAAEHGAEAPSDT